MSSSSAGIPALGDRARLTGPVLDVAPTLLGAELSTVTADGTVTIRITEVEAYDGEADPSSHAYRGRSARNAVMFGPAGYLYVYRHMGLHHCANVVTGVEGRASAVLVRAGEVVEGHELAHRRRTVRGVARTAADLARGPARLASALGLDVGSYGADLLAPDGDVRLVLGEEPERYRTGPRVGVGGPGGEAAHYPWRFWLPDEPTVSAYRAAPPPRRSRREDATRPVRSPSSGTAD